MEGLSATASTITSAALIMILVFGTFAFTRVLAVQLIGFGLAAAVLLDATLIRMVLVPAIMHIAGRWKLVAGGTGAKARGKEQRLESRQPSSRFPSVQPRTHHVPVPGRHSDSRPRVFQRFVLQPRRFKREGRPSASNRSLSALTRCTIGSPRSVWR